MALSQREVFAWPIVFAAGIAEVPVRARQLFELLPIDRSY